MKRIVSAFLLIITITLMATGCSSSVATFTKDANSTKSIQISFTAIGPKDEKMIDDKIKIVGEGANLLEVMEDYFKDKSLNLVSENGLVSTIKDLASDKENGWLLYVNGEMAPVGAAELILAEGDKIEWKYLNYAEAFPTTTEAAK